MRRILLAASAALLSLGLAGSPAVADVPQADIGIDYVANAVTVRPVDPGSPITKRDTGIGWVTFQLRLHNYGPYNSGQTMIVRDITAPPGTVFRQLDEEYFAGHPGLCTVVVPHTRVRCKIDGSIWLDTYNGGSGGTEFTIYFILKKKCVSPGRYSLIYAGDPNSSNNSVRLPLKVPGVTAADCGPKPSPAATRAKPSLVAASAKPTPSQSPAASASPSTAELSPTESAPAESTAAIVAPASDSSGTSSGGIVLAAIGAALLGVALLSGLWLYGRRRMAGN